MFGGRFSSLTTADWVTIALAALLVVLLAILVLRIWRNSRITPEERERRRRAWLVATGRTGDATLVEVREPLLFYCYDVRGIEYTASQDISKFADFLPPDLGVSDPVSIKYDARNPANSIVVSEEWCGLRLGR
jgi:hypothetical protein